MSKTYTRLLTTTFLILLFLTNTFNLIEGVKALSISYDSYDVTIDINEDSSMNISEKVEHIFNGEAHGARRDIPLTNNSCLNYYTNNNSYTCGGFDWLLPIGGYDLNNNPLPSNQFRYYEVEDSGETNGRFEWELWSDGKYVSDEEINWILKYNIYGGLKEFSDGIYFYWDLLPENRAGLITSSSIVINLPKTSVFNKDDLIIYTSLDYTLTTRNNTIVLQLEDVPTYGTLTASYRFDKDEITLPGNISYNISTPYIDNSIYLDDLYLSSENSGYLKSIPSGSHKFKVSHFGYYDYTNELNIENGKDTTLEISLTPLPWMSFLILVNNILVIFGLGLIILAIGIILRIRANKLKDPILFRTVIPLFTPPDNIRPYMLGSLKDQTVNNVDLVGTIIDLAYRGYLKIKVSGKDSKDFELIKTNKDTSDLDSIEKDIFDALFGSKDSVKNKDIQKSFPYKYASITNNIYTKMITDGFYKTSPRTTIGIYVGMGIFLIILGILATLLFSSIISSITGLTTIFTISIALIVFGLGLISISTLMTSKTNLGKRLINEIKGFRMYLHTAERFRLQKLGPDEFEKYLSYAIVFGIEEEWAKKFEGIYEGTPEWFEGGSDVYNAILISNMLRNFNTTTATSLQINPQSYSKGSGWGGSGGSFGGFSGGGGGGGSSGGW